MEKLRRIRGSAVGSALVHGEERRLHARHRRQQRLIQVNDNFIVWQYGTALQGLCGGCTSLEIAIEIRCERRQAVINSTTV
jgi:hypothetical protein